MQEYISLLLSKNRKSSTAVLFISFFLTFCVYPNIEAESFDSASSSLGSTLSFNTGSFFDANVSQEGLLGNNNNVAAGAYIWDFYKSMYDI